MLTLFRVTALLEALSWFGLLGTMYLKYMMEMPEPNKVVGMAHGVLFLAYVLLAFQVSEQQEWRAKELLIALIASLLPGATIYVERAMLKRS